MNEPSLQPSLQDRYAPDSRCFGCGPANGQGLRIKSRPVGDEVVAEWQGSRQHEAYEGALNGGIIGTLLDCHSNWAATHRLMVAGGLSVPPCTVTADYAVRFLRPTPSDRPLRLRARVVETRPDRATVEATIDAEGTVTATFRGTFVAVRPGHPAYHRW